MPRKRMISPEIWQSEDFAELSTLGKVVFIGLFSNADDEGRGRRNASYIKSILFPYDSKIRVTDIEDTLSEIGCRMSITYYDCDGKFYYSLDNWDAWQQINRPTPSKIPAPPGKNEGCCSGLTEDSLNTHGGLTEDSLNTHGGLTEDSLNTHGGLTPNKKKNKNKKGIEEEKKEKKEKKEALPSYREVYLTFNFSKKVNGLIEDWLQMRKLKKNLPTNRAVELICKKLVKVEEPLQIEALEKSIECGWTGVFLPEDSRRVPKAESKEDNLKYGGTWL